MNNKLIGSLISDDSFQINWKEIESLQRSNQWSDKNFGYNANLANSVQSDLESVAVELCSSLKATTGCANLALVGGVALNSVMNGRIKKDCGFDNIYIPSAPGDEGIAIGCAIYGLQVTLLYMSLINSAFSSALMIHYGVLYTIEKARTR